MEPQIDRQSISSPLRTQGRGRRIAVAVAAGFAVWATLAYLALPSFWRHASESGLAGRPMTTRTSAGIQGDPINFGLVGSERDAVCAFNAAGWSAANPTTLESALRIVGSVALRRPYPAAPVSALYYDGRPEDLAFEKAEGGSADRRHHIRLWRVLSGARRSSKTSRRSLSSRKRSTTSLRTRKSMETFLVSSCR